MEADQTLSVKQTRQGERVLLSINGQSFEEERSSALFKRRYQEILKQEFQLLVFIGTDSGLLPRWISKQRLGEGTRVAFVELDMARHALPNPPDAANGGNGTLILGFDDWSTALEPKELLPYCYGDRIQVIKSIGAESDHGHYYLQLSNRLNFDLRLLVEKVRVLVGTQSFFDRQLENLGNDLWPVALIKGVCSGRPAVVLGGGPSLTEGLEWAKANRDALVVIAVSRIARVLKQASIAPDFFVAVDPQPLCFDTSKEMLDMADRTCFVHANHATPMLNAQWPNLAFYTGSLFPDEPERADLNLPVHGPTVSNQALALAAYLGCPQAYLSGVDLCFDRDGYTHAEGSFEHAAGPKIVSYSRRVRTNGGWEADTQVQLAMAIKSMGVEAKMANQAGTRVINTSLSAAVIPNVDFVPVDQIELPDQPDAVWRQIRARLPTGHDSLPSRRSRLASILSQATDRCVEFENMLKLVEDAILASSAHGGSAVRWSDRTTKIEARLDSEHGALSKLVKGYAAPDFLTLPQTGTKTQWSSRKMQDWSRRYYTIYRDAIHQLLTHLTLGIDILETRLLECAEYDPPIAFLANRWRNEQTPGRFRYWTNRFAGDLPPAARDVISDLSAEYTALVDFSEETSGDFLGQSVTTTPLETLECLLRLFKEGQAAELMQTVEKLREIDFFDHPTLENLASGLIAESRGDLPIALEYYETVVATIIEAIGDDFELARDKPALMPSLERMLTINLRQEDKPNIARILDLLSLLSPRYTEQYAEILRLTGDYKGAIEVLTTHLAAQPEDLSAMMLLGRLMLNIRETGAAKWVFKQVLAVDPKRADAQALLRKCLDAGNKSALTSQ